ncbi:M56 family metallopeptidase [Faecalibaculum rodentium]|nr:M56 family metallopeptidase [Faecalibaculum rodentium]
MEFMWYEIYPDIPVSNILWFLWIAIAVIKLVIYINRISQMRSIVKKISENSEKTSVRELLHDPTLEDYPVYISELIDSPKIIGYKRNIYLPKVKFSNNQLDNIINHEIQHIRHFDFFKKQLLELLIIIYWWFPPVYLLRKQYHIYSELRADGFAVKDTSEYEHLKYAQTLIEVQMVLCNEKKDSFNRYSTMFIADGVQTLKWRIESLNSRSFIKRSNILILFFIAIIPFLRIALFLSLSFQHQQESILMKSSGLIHIY